jgi:hypothetical protein
MKAATCVRSTGRWLAAGIGLVTGGYAAYAALAWRAFGHPRRPAGPEEADALLDRFMPVYDVAERHHVRVAAPPEGAYAAATALDLERSRIVRAIFRTREAVMGARPDREARPRELLPLMRSLGWGVLAEVPDREIVMGAVTRPWEADVVFRALPPREFAAFREPGWVKIAWTLRADPTESGASTARTETRAVATDPQSRARFRRYWSLASPGIVLIRRLAMGLLKKEAERAA